MGLLTLSLNPLYGCYIAVLVNTEIHGNTQDEKEREYKRKGRKKRKQERKIAAIHSTVYVYSA